MSDKLKEIAKWIFEQGKNITRESIEEKLQEAYNQGKIDSFIEQLDKTIDNIRFNTTNKIKHDKKALYESNFYDKPSEEDVVKMKALEYLEEHIEEIITQYKT
jgi:hypothetical protein